jgi:nicotinate-nucleotide pyrophosphorylase (carboxylating)
MPDALDAGAYRELVRLALAEDLGAGDITTRAVVPQSRETHGVFLAKAPLVLAGLDVAREVFAQIDPAVRFDVIHPDGEAVEAGVTVALAEGRAGSLLAAERTALNFLQYLCGIATVTRAFVDAAAGRLSILDTRKTTPGFRALAKYAVRAGGGRNHRVGLFDGILIKDNHIRVAGNIGEAVRRVRDAAPGKPIEVETQSLAEVDDALAAEADVIMLDNLDEATTRAAIRHIDGRAKVELSGNVTLDRVRRLADSGADFVSVGALTHSAPAADISFEIEL